MQGGKYHDTCSNINFICDSALQYNNSLTNFNTCLKAVDCHMHEQMRVTPDNSNEIITFMHQMIPHHENAVNMAKTLLKVPAAAADADIK